MPKRKQTNELKLTRVFNASVETVWDAWSDPEQVAQWWGPRGFTITTHSKELRPGGIWHYTMHGPDGVDYPNKTLYYEVEKHAKLVYDHGGYDERKPLFRVTVIFSKIGKKTKLEMTMSFESAERAGEIKKFIKQANGESTWDRLAEYLEKTSSGLEKFVINRSFDAPIETVFEMWTNPTHLAKWLPPTGATMEFIDASIKEGGSTFWKMTAPYGEMYGRAKYIAIDPPRLLVYTQQFCDKNKNISRHPLAPTWPETMLTTVEFESESQDQTRVTITWEVHGNCSADELEVFVKARTGMTMGWNGSFDKLDGELERLR